MVIRTGVIYLIKNTINGKVYIGQTIQNPKVRFRDHFRLDRCDTILLSRAGIKYGKSSFCLEILESDIPKDQLDEKELFYIKKYRSQTPNGYNIAAGGASTFTQPKLNKLQEQQAIAMYKAGVSMKNIGKVFGRDKKAIKGVLVRNNIMSRPTKTKYLGITKECLVELIDSGMNAAQIARHYSVVPSNISYYIKKFNLKSLFENRVNTVNAEM